jgi:hypothetical protein
MENYRICCAKQCALSRIIKSDEQSLLHSNHDIKSYSEFVSMLRVNENVDNFI